MVNAEFVDALASDAAVPGGGGGAAYAGALAAALGAMVGNITAGKPKFADVADDIRASVVELDAARTRLLELIDEDAEAFSRLAATWKLSRATEEEKAARHAAEQAALVGACEVPVAHHARVCGRNRVRRIPREQCEQTRAFRCGRFGDFGERRPAGSGAQCSYQHESYGRCGPGCCVQRGMCATFNAAVRCGPGDLR